MPKLSKSFLNANYCNYNSVFVCILIFPFEQNFPEGSEVLGSFNWKSLEPRMESSLSGNVQAICTFLQGHAGTQINVRGQSPHSTSISARGHLCCVHILAAPHCRGMLQMCPVLITEAAESGGSEDHPVNCGGKSITGAADLPEQRRVYTSRL